ncbi:MAG: SBBP repeat-containing protein [Bacteroidia bacterium]|nr:SBBP repeat-containing protein [Bacteroidia bacterium]
MKKTLYLLITILLTQFTITAQAPAFQWATAIGGNAGQDVARKVKIDAIGNVYVVGTFNGIVDFDSGPATYTLASNGGQDVYVSKSDANGNFLWARSFGSTSTDHGRSIDLDASGNVFITGAFQGTVDFDPGPSVSNLASNGNYDIFILKLNSTGNFVWAKQIGGSSADQAYSIILDATANIYVAGNFLSTVDFDPNAGVQNLTAIGILHDSFILKLNSAGNYVWAKSFGGNQSDVCNDISIDGSGNVLSIGMFQSIVDFDPGAATYTLQSNGDWDFYISKLDAAGNFIWARSIGGSGLDRGDAIAADAVGNVYCVGTFINTVDFDPNLSVNTLTANGLSNDAYLLKLDASGSFVFVNQIGSTADENALDVFLDGSNAVYLSGSFQGTVDFDAGPPSYTLSATGYDGYVLKTDQAGNFIGMATISGSLNESSSGVSLDQTGNIFVVGAFQGVTDFDPNVSTYTLSSQGAEDAYVLKLSSCFVPVAPSNITPISNQIVCAGSSTTLMATSSNTVNWFATATSTNIISTGNSFTTPTLSAGSYTYYAEANGCAPSISRTPVSVTVNPTPAVTVVSNSSLLCVGQTATLTASGATSYSWNTTATSSTIAISPTITTSYTLNGTDANGCSNLVSITQSVSACTGFDTLSSSILNSIHKIYPNPNSGKFIIETNEQSNLILTDIFGKIIINKVLSFGQNIIDIENYIHGIYFVKLKIDEKYINFKIIKN